MALPCDGSDRATVAYKLLVGYTQKSLSSHERVEKDGESSTFVNEEGKQEIKIPDDLITWVFEEGMSRPKISLQV